MACDILVLQQETERPLPLAVKAWSANLWIAGKFPKLSSFLCE